jgi:two-component system sensor histidine kinase BaeS
MPEAQFIQYVFKRLLIVNLITLTMLGGIVFYLLRRWFKPVQAMNQSLQSIANRQVFLPIQYRIHDEFWPLVHTINTLQETLDRQRLIRSTFLSDVSHELKTPITALKCLIDGIQDGIIPYDAAQLELISHELNRLLIIARKVSGDALDNQSEHLQETNILEVLLRIQIEYS